MSRDEIRHYRTCFLKGINRDMIPRPPTRKNKHDTMPNKSRQQKFLYFFLFRLNNLLNFRHLRLPARVLFAETSNGQLRVSIVTLRTLEPGAK